MHLSSFKRESIEPNELMGFNRFDLDYWKNPDVFSSLTSGIPDTDSIRNQMNARSGFAYRNQLVAILQKQYKHFDTKSLVFEQINKLKHPNTFTVICAHQPCLFGGPMFWIYKILSIIKLCKVLEEKYSGFTFIPVYFSGNEDHDFEEINHLTVFQKKISWFEKSGMATGRLPITGLENVITELESVFQRNEIALQFFKKNREWLKTSNTYAEYFRLFVHELFGNRGLIYFNPDDRDAKSIFIPIIEKELLETFIQPNTADANLQIQEMNYPLQVQPRELNLFYHHETGRKRITKKDGLFQLVDSEITWTEAELISLLKTHPENFSPNVLMRPLYQEMLFPNVSFIGGGGEIAYWIQLKKCFETAGIPYPVLFRRLSAFCFDQNILSKITKSPFGPETFLLPLHDLEKAFIKLHSNTDDSLIEDLSVINQLLDKISKNCESLDPPTKSSIEGELQKIRKSLEHIDSKRTKVLKQKHEQDLQNIKKIKDLLFPANSIQERIQSFLPLYFDYGNDFFDLIEKSFEPGLFTLELFMEMQESNQKQNTLE